jgi:glycosyltransferase involved in cell wall biosynthesis
MKVLHYSSSLSRSAGGLYYSVSGLTRACADLGVDCSVIGRADEFFEEDKHQWGDLRMLPHSTKSAYGFDFGVFRTIAAEKPDIFHVHGIWSAASIYGLFAAMRGIPVVVSPHGMVDPWIVKRNAAVKWVHSTLFEHPLFKRAFIRALNRSESGSVSSFSPGSDDRTFILPNGIDQNAAPDTGGERQGAIYLGRLHSKKQVLELAKFWAESFPGFPLTIAGWGDDQYEAEIAEVAAASPNVSFVGSLYGEAKIKALRAARIFVLPSLSEGLPMAVLEALELGTVPVITDECNLPELFEEGVALRVETDFSDFKAVIDRVMAMTPAELAAIAAKGQVVAKRYNWSEIAKGLTKKYEEILKAA